MNEIKITTTHTFSKEDISDLIVTALEGGINYWCRKAKIKLDTEGNYFNVPKEDQDKVIYASDAISYGGTLILFDAESTDKWELNLENVQKGIQMHCEKRNIAPAGLMDNYDAEDADCIVQYAVFNELTFG
ncbi:MAG: hypothetical protein WC428_01850 [Candidatus Paceibacterota bacterium]|jgi:hypothetical protein